MKAINKLMGYCTKNFGFPKVRLEDVFTPATAADINYISRKEIDSVLGSVVI